MSITLSNKGIKEVKLSFLGDVMCEEPFLRAALRKGGGIKYNFDGTFNRLVPLLSKSDFIIANLETPIAGKDLRYTHELYSFNSPLEFAEALKSIGASLVLTANNHCCDRGAEGIRNTQQALDAINLPHTGTFPMNYEGKRYYSANIDGVKIAFISCTATTNAVRTQYAPRESEVLLLDEQETRIRANGRLDIVGNIKSFVVRKIIGDKLWLKIKLAFGREAKKAYQDDTIKYTPVDAHLNLIGELIDEALTENDLVIVCPHIGGQFNPEPGRMSKYICNELVRFGASAVVASHAHVVQRTQTIGKALCAYSLGNVTMSISTPYIIMDNHPDYGAVLHLYVSPKGIKRASYSLIKMQEESGFIKVVPVHELLKTAPENVRNDIINSASEVARRIASVEPTFLLEDETVFWSDSSNE